jgi:hypothetical protein
VGTQRDVQLHKKKKKKKKKPRKLRIEKSHNLQSRHQILVSSKIEGIEGDVTGMGE